jgi:hypothetical protein
MVLFYIFEEDEETKSLLFFQHVMID